MRSLVVALSLFCLISLANAQVHDPADPSKHTVQFITVDKDFKLEVLDWGAQAGP